MENLNSIIEAANNGDAVSQYKLARAYETGDGVGKSIDIAREWYEKSADNGYKNAEVKLRLLPVQDTTQSELDKQPIVKQAYQAPTAPTVIQTSNLKNNNSSPSNANTPQTVYPQKSKIAAALLAWFLGCYGVHDFYLGYKKNGIIKIILTVTIIGSLVSYIWAIIDLIKIICNGKFDSNGQPLK